jgi:hypothetical protein
VIKHGLKPAASDVALALAVDRVTDDHVVGGHGFGDGAGSATDTEEPAGDLLSRADLGEGAVFALVEIDLKRLLMGPDAG